MHIQNRKDGQWDWAPGDYSATNVYKPSSFELEWLTKKHHGRICEMAKAQENEAKVWLSYTRGNLYSGGKPMEVREQKNATCASFLK